MSRQLVHLESSRSSWIIKTYLDGDGTYSLEVISPDYNAADVATVRNSFRELVNGWMHG